MTLKDLREQLQEDLLCILDDADEETKDKVCQAVVERFDEFLFSWNEPIDKV